MFKPIYFFLVTSTFFHKSCVADDTVEMVQFSVETTAAKTRRRKTLALSSKAGAASAARTQPAASHASPNAPESFREYVKRMSATAPTKQFRCGRSGVVKNLNFSDASPPEHFLPAVHSMPRVYFFAETKHGSCNLLKDEAACTMLEDGAFAFPDRWLVDFMELTLDHCRSPSGACVGMDIGSNLGLVSLRLLELGLSLTAIEPQLDLCCAGEASAQHNGFGHNSLFLCGGAAASRTSTTLTLTGESGHRPGGTKSIVDQYHEVGLPKKATQVPLYYILDIIPPGSTLNFLKIDTDSVDCELLRVVMDNKIKFDAASLETWTGLCDDNAEFSRLLSDLQASGYDVYLTPADEHQCERASKHWQSLTDGDLQLLDGIKLHKFRQYSQAEWTSHSKEWRKQCQMLVWDRIAAARFSKSSDS